MWHSEKLSALLDVQVRRIDDNTVKLCWEPEDHKPTVSLCSGLRRKDALQSVPVVVSDKGCVKITGLDPTMRYYFH